MNLHIFLDQQKNDTSEEIFKISCYKYEISLIKINQLNHIM